MRCTVSKTSKKMYCVLFNPVGNCDLVDTELVTITLKPGHRIHLRNTYILSCTYRYVFYLQEGNCHRTLSQSYE